MYHLKLSPKSITISFRDLSYNKLTKLVAHTFENMVMLRALSLAENKITHIEMSTFDELYKLEVL